MTTQGLRITQVSRRIYRIAGVLFPAQEGVTSYYRRAQELAHQIREHKGTSDSRTTPSAIYAAGLLGKIHRRVIERYLQDQEPSLFSDCLKELAETMPDTYGVLESYQKHFPAGDASTSMPPDALRELFITLMARENPALMDQLGQFFDDRPLRRHTSYIPMTNRFIDYLSRLPKVSDTGKSLPDLLLEPARRFPHDLTRQLQYILEHWKEFIPDLIEDLLRVLDVISEEHRPSFPPGPGPSNEPDYSSLDPEIEQFSRDSNWMPRVIMIAKSSLVWLDQLSKTYGYSITRLDQIPDRELDLFSERGFTVLWLIGIWERSAASRVIKHRCGNSEAEASAYSLKRYDIAESLGGWEALDHLRRRCFDRGIRLASDMVPNHTGLDSDWMIEHPELFLQTSYPPFPSYSYNSEQVCSVGSVEVHLEDHYYDQSDAAVTFKRYDSSTGEERYIYHGNDGTTMPWNDTAQLDYLNPDTRETVIQTILHVAKNFPVIRFDAAMTLAKRHIQRLWYPKPGHGGDIPGRSAFGLTDAQFHQAMGKEFWREVVDRVAAEAPDTLLLAEAFWMMEGYFVRTLGMHRVYNSAFMNMLKLEDNEKYRNTIKHTLTFDPEILKRFVNFMNNPDEETAIAQFGDGDKYFGVTTLLITMPGLPMFGHGQIEGFREKYGMEYTKAYWDEAPDQHLVEEHYRRIFPLMKLRYLFANAQNFRLYDFHTHTGVDQAVFAYTNRLGSSRALVLYNNAYEQTSGWFSMSAPYLERLEDETRHKSESLCSALDLTAKAGYYVTFHNPIDSLTYIRSSMEICSKGMYAHLTGYETQVFLNFQEVFDEFGLYHDMASLLQGKGSPNFTHELALLRLRPLHDWILPFIEEDQLILMVKLISGDNSCLDMVKQRWLALYRGLLQVWNTTFHASGSSLPDQVPQSALRALLEYLDTTARVFSDIPKSGNPPSQIQRFLSDSLRVMPEFPVVLLASVLVVPLAETIPGHRWSAPLMLETLFDQHLEAAGVSHAVIPRTLLGAEFIHHFRYWAREIEGKSSRELLERLFRDQLFQEYTRCNWYNNVQWFHKESFQEALVLLAFCHLCSGSGGDDQVFSLLYSWYTKEPLAEYRVSQLFELV